MEGDILEFKFATHFARINDHIIVILEKLNYILVYELHEEDALRKIGNQLAEIPKTSYNLLKYLW